MEVRVCKNCRRLFKYIYGPELCQDCTKLLAEDKLGLGEQQALDQSITSQHNSKTIPGNLNSQDLQSSKKSLIKPVVKDEEAKFDQVRDYVMSHPRASVAQISEDNDIPPTKLFEWIRDERLQFSDESEYAWFQCEKCGTKIKSGRLCNRCKIR